MSTQRIGIDVDEWYPVYSLTDENYADKFDVPTDLVERARHADAEFNAVQVELGRIYKAQS